MQREYPLKGIVILVVFKPFLNSSFFGQKKYLMSITDLARAIDAKNKAEYDQKWVFFIKHTFFKREELLNRFPFRPQG
jgi:hypothetical protein